MQRTSPRERACDDCEACCVVLEIAQLGKAAGTACMHLNGRGCGIYDDRPTVCRGFSCSWAMGDPALAESMRPDLCGVMVWVNEIAGALVIQVHELRGGALQQAEVGAAVAFYRSLFTVRVTRADGSMETWVPSS